MLTSELSQRYSGSARTNTIQIVSIPQVVTNIALLMPNPLGKRVGGIWSLYWLRVRMVEITTGRRGLAGWCRGRDAASYHDVKDSIPKCFQHQ